MVTQITQLAALVGGRLVGDSTVECAGANPLGVASDSDITMLDTPSNVDKLDRSVAVAVVTKAELDTKISAQIIVSDPHSAFAQIVSHFRPPIQSGIPGVGVDSTAKIAPSASIHPTATIGADCEIGERSVIMPGVVVMPRCKIGDDCVIHPNVVLYEHTELGDRVTLHANTVIGAHGFGYREVDGQHVPTAQLGYVKIESDVETGACVTIDRGTYGATLIGTGTKIDNQVQVAHNCRIGKYNLLCSQVGIAGSCTTGDYVIMAGQVGIKDHINIAKRVIIGAQCGVMNDCVEGEIYLGAPATPQREQMQIMAVQRKLPEMRRQLKTLRGEVAKLSKAAEANQATEAKDASGPTKRAA